MKLEDQVCSLELAKRLKELGVKQESYFQWYRESEGWSYNLGQVSVFQTSDPAPYFAAFSVAELGEMLPGILIHKGELWQTQLWKSDFSQEVSYSANCKKSKTEGDPEKGWMTETFIEKTEADARAKMIICLIEQGIVKP